MAYEEEKLKISIRDGAIAGVATYLGLVLGKEYTSSKALPWALGVAGVSTLVRRYVYTPEISVPEY